MNKSVNQTNLQTLDLAAHQFEVIGGFSNIEEIVIVIPAFNEEKNLRQILPRIPSEICQRKTSVLLIDDGSTDKTKELALSHNINMANIPINMGQGAALCLGYKLALKGGAKIVVTMDADGQHCPQDIQKLVQPVVNGVTDLVIGSRILGQSNHSSSITTLGIMVFNHILSGMIHTKITDCSSGFKSINAEVLAAVTPFLIQNRFHSPELIIITANKGFKIGEAPANFSERISGKSKMGNTGFGFGISFALVMFSTWFRVLIEKRYSHKSVAQS